MTQRWEDKGVEEMDQWGNRIAWIVLAIAVGGVLWIALAYGLGG